MSGARPQDGLHVRRVEADLRVGPVEDDRHPVGVDVHQAERLDPDLHVLQTRQVERADDHGMCRLVDGGDRRCCERRRRIDDRPRRTPLGPRRSRSPSRSAVTASAWSGRTGASSTSTPSALVPRYPRSFPPSRLPSRGHQVVDGALRLDAQHEADVAELEVEVDQQHALAGGGQDGRQVRADGRLADTALGAEHGDDRRHRRRRGRRRAGAVDARAIALCTASLTTGASAGSSTISCAPARSASARLPLAGPGMATISAISGRDRRLSARTSSTSSTPGLNISIAWLRSRSAAPTASPKSLRPDATCIPLPPLGTAPSSRLPGNDRCAATVSRTSLMSAPLAQDGVQELVAAGAAKHAADVVDHGPDVVGAARRAEDEVDVALLLREHHVLDVARR